MKKTVTLLSLAIAASSIPAQASQPTPEQPTLILSPAEIRNLMVPENTPDPDLVAQGKYWAIRNLTMRRGADLAVLDAFLAQDRCFSKVHYWTFATFVPAIDNTDLPLFEHVLAHHPDAINKKDKEENSPLNQTLQKIALKEDVQGYCWNMFKINSDEVLQKNLSIWRTMIKLLVNHGADKESPSYITSREGYRLQTILRKYSGTPLLQAIDAADYDIVAFLVAQGAHLKDINGNSALEKAKKLHYKDPQVYDKIITLLENYQQSRLENRIFQQDRKLPVAVHSLITEFTPASHAVPQTQGLRPYVAAPISSALMAKAQRAALNEVKKGLKNNDLKPLSNFIEKYPKNLNAQDEAGDSLLLLAVKSQNDAVVKSILKKLAQLDQAEKSINERLIQALRHTNLDGDNVYNVAIKVNNQEIIHILKPYHNAPVWVLLRWEDWENGDC